MSDLMPNGFQMIVLQKEDLPKHQLNDIIVHCRTIEQFQLILANDHSTIRILACTKEMFLDVAPLLLRLNLDTIYILTNHEEIIWPYELELMENPFQTIQIATEKQLMRHLCTKMMLCYYNQGIVYQANGDYGLANSCLLVARDAIIQTKQFV